MPGILYKNSGLVIKQKLVQVWVPDPSTPYTQPFTGYSLGRQEQISWTPAGYSYKGKLFSTYSEAKAYRDCGEDPRKFIVGLPGASPQVGYYYINGKPARNMFYAVDPATGIPMPIKSAVRR